ncbi:Ig-like domain repeat protein [Nocardioides iriomotensis]|uniref:alpha-amylase n=1 Tax=Nocardioides iriomotensis TaxID=715784 RepID=A0A4Q5IWG0_9ACTN|nr:Ig-like domain repeat protein [Nocardioides iriomotensis]RYU10447.1 hypothetical protein ETU37_16915 [Nocardioides iriomotensis]
MTRARTLVGRTTALLLITSGAVMVGSTTAHAADGTITGTITAANRPITYGYADLYKWDAVGKRFAYVTYDFISAASPDKTFSFTVAPGKYAVEVYGSRLPDNSVGDAWALPETLSHAGVIEVTDGGTVRADVSYPTMYTVSGTVSGARAGESEARLLRWEPSHNSFEYFEWDDTRYNGSYSFDHVPAGTYTMEFERPDGTAMGEEKWLGGNAAMPTAPSGSGVFSVGSSDLVKNFNFDGPAPAPVATTAPAIPATAAVGVPITATPGAWTETPSLAFQWLRNGVAIPGATSTTYVPTVADAGGTLAFTVAATQAYTATGNARTGDAAVAKLVSAVTAKAKKKVELGKKAKLKVGVSVPGVASPTGMVKVFEGKDKVAKGVLDTTDGGKLTIKVKNLELGKHKLKVEYLGNTVTNGATDKVKVKVVR